MHITYKGTRLEMHQAGGKWVIISPEPCWPIPAKITRLLYGITGLKRREILEERRSRSWRWIHSGCRR